VYIHIKRRRICVHNTERCVFTCNLFCNISQNDEKARRSVFQILRGVAVWLQCANWELKWFPDKNSLIRRRGRLLNGVLCAGNSEISLEQEKKNLLLACSNCRESSECGWACARLANFRVLLHDQSGERRLVKIKYIE